MAGDFQPSELGKLPAQLRLQFNGDVVESSLENTGKEAARGIRDVDTEVMLELRGVQSERIDVLSLDEGAGLEEGLSGKGGRL